jgi:hypothetical protein
MTREEAIEALKYSIGVFPVTDRAVSALDMAVKALEQEPCGDCISRQAALDEIISRLGISGEKYLLESERYIYQIIKDLPPVTPKAEPCEDAISRQAAIDTIESWLSCDDYNEAERHIMRATQSILYDLPTVTPKQRTGHCKDCKYFEYDSVAKVDGVPLIVAHEICKRWGDGCKTWEDGYCFLFEPQESEGVE